MTSLWDPPEFDADLILKYDRPGPRYTSYPPAPFFVEDFGEAEYLAEIERTNPAGGLGPLSFYFHLPFCRSVCYFCGCNVHYTKDKSLGETYVDHLLLEMDKLSTVIESRRPVEQIHWGGGTPTFLPAATLRRLFEGISQRFSIAEGAEIGVEIDPREVEDEHFELLAEVGFNRISMGVQDFHPEVQQAVHRIQPLNVTRAAIERCRELGFESINVDLIYGLPHQTVERFQETIDQIIELDPDRIAVFNFAYLPEAIPHQRAIPREALPDAAAKLGILESVVRGFTEARYVYVGMDHFAKPDDELTLALLDRSLGRNFQGYTTKSGCDLYGLGATSIGQVGRCYVQNRKQVVDYQQSVAATGLAAFRGVRLTDDDLLRREVITRLMCHFVVHKRDIEDRFGISFDATFQESLEKLRPMEQDGLLSLLADRVEIHALGRLLVRNIAMAFDAYLDRSDRPRFSRTV